MRGELWIVGQVGLVRGLRRLGGLGGLGQVRRVGQVGRGENFEFWIGHKLQAYASGGISSEWLISFKISSIIQKIDVILSLQSIGVVFIFLQLQIYKSFALLFLNFSTSKLNYNSETHNDYKGWNTK